MTEVWKPVPGMEGVEASTMGRFRVRTKLVRSRGGIIVIGGKPRFGAVRKGRHVAIIRYKFYLVSRLVCSAFHGPPPSPNSVCMHLDENSLNDRPENLAWGSQVENMNAPKYKEYCRGRVGENSTRAKWAARRRAEQESNEARPS